MTFWVDIEGKISAIAAAEVVATENTKEKEQVVVCIHVCELYINDLPIMLGG